jgi:hypothetical protein
MAGVEYSIGGSTALIFGLGFERNFLDITKNFDYKPYNQLPDKISQNVLKIRVGVNF